ncbi:phosphate acyltransferase PlsX [Chloroflexota bacterium]
MIIAVDATGGEYAPHEIVKGVIKAIHEYKVEVALVGRKTILHVLAGRYLNKPGLTIINASQVIGPHESPIEAVRNKPNSSIVVGTSLVRNGAASAFVSAGNTGAVLYSALFNLGKIKGIERPAIGSIINISAAAPVLLIDAGANANCRPSYLVQFAQLGTTYAREIFGIASPRVGLLNNGNEETKGNRLAQESYNLLKNTNLNFIGNIEGQDISKRTADVIVTDGFTGNIVLKTIEGLGDTFLSWRQGGGHTLLYDIGLGSLFKRIDYREYGGACLLGVKGNVIIAHGRSQAKAIKNAIGLAKQVIERDITQIISEGIHE